VAAPALDSLVGSRRVARGGGGGLAAGDARSHADCLARCHHRAVEQGYLPDCCKEPAQTPWEHHTTQKKNVESADIPEATMSQAIRQAIPCRATTPVPPITAKGLRDRTTIAIDSVTPPGEGLVVSPAPIIQERC
jgi:hypothetical protein